MRAGPGKSETEACSAEVWMQPGPDQIRGLGLLFPYALQLALLTDLNVARRKVSAPGRLSGAHQETERITIDSRGVSSFSILSGEAMASLFFFWRSQSGRRPARQPSTVLGVWLLSIFVDSKDLLPDVTMMNLSGTSCFESRCMSLSQNGLYRWRQTLPSAARRLQGFASLQSNLGFSTLPGSIYRSWSAFR